jgi:hypothetical protein
MAEGPGVTGPFWPIARPYQPSSRALNPKVMSITNPIWVDNNSDGKIDIIPIP